MWSPAKIGWNIHTPDMLPKTEQNSVIAVDRDC